MPDRLEAESAEAKRFFNGLRGILGVRKSEIETKINKQRERRKHARQAKISTRKPKSKA